MKLKHPLVPTAAAVGLLAAIALVVGTTAASADSSLPSGEQTHGQVSVEPAYDDSTGNFVFLATPAHLAPLGATNVINGVNSNAVAPLYIVVYPPGTSGTFNCQGVPGNCPDHDGAIAGIATSTEAGVYGTNPSMVPGHDHLVGVASTHGDFNVPWHVYVEVFTSKDAVTHITTLAQLKAAWASGAILQTSSGQGIDTGITFLCAVVSQAAYNAGSPVG